MSKLGAADWASQPDDRMGAKNLLKGAFDERPWGDATERVVVDAALTVADKLPREDVRDVLEAMGLVQEKPQQVAKFSLAECFEALATLGKARA